MNNTIPEVFLIASPSINLTQVEFYLGGLDEFYNEAEDSTAIQWLESRLNGIDDGELLVEFAGRLCYRSWAPGMNKNVTKVRKDIKEYFANILSSRHGSVLEHANYTFVFHNVSRVFTHELVRHRAGVAISQESLRYVRLDHIGFRIPPVLQDEKIKPLVIEIVERLEEFQKQAAEEFGLDDNALPFHVKKEITSALRRLAPLGLSTGMVWTANLRTLRHVIEARTNPGAEEEIRLVFDKVGAIMKHKCPNLFQDFERKIVEGKYAWVPKHSKV